MKNDVLAALITETVTAAGATLHDWQFDGRRLRVYVDAPGGITIGDCARISERLSRRLDAGTVIAGPYTLEVSSPGIERTLRTREDFARALGQRVAITTADGFTTGFVAEVRDDAVVVAESRDKKVRIPLAAIREAVRRVTTEELFARGRT